MSSREKLFLIDFIRATWLETSSVYQLKESSHALPQPYSVQRMVRTRHLFPSGCQGHYYLRCHLHSESSSDSGLGGESALLCPVPRDGAHPEISVSCHSFSGTFASSVGLLRTKALEESWVDSDL
jgi:hypothetical protein